MSDERRIGERLLVRAPCPEDRSGYEALLLDPEVEVRLREAGAAPHDRDWVARRLAADEGHWREHGFGPWAIFELGGDALVGRGGLNTVELEGRKAIELSWTVTPVHWNRGFATEAGRAALAWAGELGLGDVVALVTPDNAPSRRVAEKLGLVEDGEALHGGLTHLVYR